VQVGSLEIDSQVVCLSWNNESNRLLVACESGSIQIWSYNPNSFEALKRVSDINKTAPATVQFSIQPEEHDTTQEDHDDEETDEFDTNLFSSTNIFKRLWETRLANTAKCLRYSPDGSLFATFSEVFSVIQLYFINNNNKIN
jgi:WD40 repeat protein